CLFFRSLSFLTSPCPRLRRRPRLSGGISRLFESLPLDGLFRLSPRLIELYDPIAGAVQMVVVRHGHPAFMRLHPSIACKEQRFRVGVSLLPGKARAERLSAKYGSQSSGRSLRLASRASRARA